jgi:hypothetical protein
VGAVTGKKRTGGNETAPQVGGVGREGTGAQSSPYDGIMPRAPESRIGKPFPANSF